MYSFLDGQALPCVTLGGGRNVVFVLPGLARELSDSIHDVVGGLTALFTGHLLAGLLKMHGFPHADGKPVRVNHI